MSASSQKVKDVFVAAVKMAPNEWDAFLAEACGEDEALRGRVRDLLDAHLQAASFLGSPAPGIPAPLVEEGAEKGAGATIGQPNNECLGAVIGPYKLLQQIGEGGMGVVYMAEQKEPVERRVALKIIKPGMDSRQVIARFEAERQALALMDHPNIARVLDAGTTEEGRPYFVMELVKGIPITQYCDDHQLTPRQRLELFLHVCQAVQHAHHKGIIHRDLKPTNVLVADYDQHAVPKIIDFGVAKAVGQRLTEKTMFTEFGQVVGTIEYMSPEQAKLNQLDIDTRTDVYSLGVLLYELLTGETPLDRKRLRSAAFDEMLRIIREEEPPRPSMRLSSSGTLASVAACRHTEPKKLTLLVRGELDWIVMKALEKDRNRRYETANSLGMDIQRYLNDEHVLACPPSAAYRFRKFARRNKGALATAALLAAALVLGTVVSTWQAVRATKAESLAHARLEAEEQARRDAEAARDGEARQRRLADEQRDLARKNAQQADAERKRAEAERERAEANFAQARAAVDEYLNQVTESELLTVPGLQRLREDLLEAALGFYAEFTKERADDPTIRRELATAHFRLARIQSELGNAEASSKANTEAIRLYEQLRDSGDPELDVQVGLARAYFHAGRHDDTVALCQQILKTDATHAVVRSLLADTYNALALRQSDANKLDAALKYHQQAFELRESLAREFPDKPEYLAQLGGTVNNLGVLLGKQGKTREALAMFQRAVEYSAQAYELQPHSILWGRWLCIGLRNVAGNQRDLGQQDEALRSYERLVAASRKLAFENPGVAALRGDLSRAYRDLANCQRQLGQAAEADRDFRRARDVLENMPRETATQLFELASVYAALAQPPEGTAEANEEDAAQYQRHADLAMQALREAVDAGYANPQALKTNDYFAPLRERDDFKELLATLEKAATAQQLANRNVGEDEQKLADRRQAVDLLKQLVSDQPAEVRHRITLAATLQSIGEIQMGLKQFDEAEKSLEEAIARRQRLAEEFKNRERTAGHALVDLITARIALGRLYWEIARFPEGHRIWQECSHDLRSIAEENQEDKVLQQRIASEERVICDGYGRYGLWPLAGEYVRRSVEFRRVSSHEQDAEFAALLLLPENANVVEEYLAMLAEAPPAADERETWRITHLVRTVAMARPKADISDDLVARARKAQAARNDSPWWKMVLATALYRAGEFQEAQDLVSPLGEMGSHLFARPQLLYVKCIVASAVGKESEALANLAHGESLYKQACLESLAYLALNSLGLPNENWHELLQVQALRREALRLIHSDEPPPDPWQHLIQARGYRLIGEVEKSDAELAAAVAAAPDDPEIWMARAKLFEQWDEQERSTEADWQKVVELAGNDSLPWIHRGRWYAQRGEHEKADADFAKAASLTPGELNKFLEAGWWVVGPYPQRLAEFCPPEIDPDPSRPVYVVDPKTGLSDQAVAWRSVATEGHGLMVQRGHPALDHNHEHVSLYAVTYVYSPDERTETLFVGGDDLMRVWLNGRQVHETMRVLGSGWGLDRVPVTLRPGRNTLLVKVNNDTGPYYFRLRLGDGPVDRGWALADLALWEEARDVFSRGFEGGRQSDSWLWQGDSSIWHDYAAILLASGDVDGYRRHCAQILQKFGETSDADVACWAAMACGLSPDGITDSARLVELARKGQSPGGEDSIWRADALSRALYRAGEFQEAIDVRFDPGRLRQIAVVAMAHHRLGQTEGARRWLAELESLYEQMNRDALPTPQSLVGRRHWHGSVRLRNLAWNHIAYREAKTVIHGPAFKEGPHLNALQARAREELKRRDPLTSSFDHALMLHADQPRLWLARGRRLAELGRFDEAEVDFNQAVELAPDDPHVRAARAAFLAGRGDLDEAADDFHRALSLLPDDRHAGQPIYLEIARRDDVFDRLVTLRPSDGDLRINRMILRVWEGDLEAARADADRLMPVWLNSDSLSVLLLSGDRDEFEKRRATAAQWDTSPGGAEPAFKVTMLGLAPANETMTAEMLSTAEDMWQRLPKDSWRRWTYGLAQLRAGKFQDAIATLEAAQSHALPNLPLLAMAHHRMGNAERAREALEAARVRMELYRSVPPERLPYVFGSGNLASQNWLLSVVIYSEARTLIDDPEALAREQALESTRQAEFQSQRLNRAEAAWQRAVDLAGEDPMPWIHRGRWYAQRGEHEKADADFARAASLTPDELNKFLEAGWWVVGPYPKGLAEFCPPEIDADPSKPVHVVDPESGLSDEPVRWAALGTAPGGLVDLAGYSGRKANTSVYAFSYVYSPGERTVLLLIDRHQPMRLWVNGKLVAEHDPTATTNPWYDIRRVPVALRKGRNEVLIKSAAPSFTARVGDSPQDRWLLLAEQGRFAEAAEALERAERSPQSSAFKWGMPLLVLAAAGNAEQLEKEAAQLVQSIPDNLGMRMWIALACAQRRSAVFDAHADQLVGFANQGAREHPGYGEQWAALVNYRAGRFEQSREYLETLGPGNAALNPLRALLAHQAGDAPAVSNWLVKSQSVFANEQRGFLDRGRSGRSPLHGWTEWVQFQTLLAEAEGLITPDVSESRESLRKLRQELARRWKDSPETMAFDHAVSTAVEPGSFPHPYLARGRRLAELGRFDEAEADLNKAVELAPNEPDVLSARAVFFADRGQPDKAAADFHAALNLFNDDAKTRWSWGVPIDLEVAQREDVFERLTALRPDDRLPWQRRMILRDLQGDFNGAAADAQRLPPLDFCRAAHALWQGDREEFNRIRAQDLSEWHPRFAVSLLGLAPTEELMTTEILETAERMWREEPQTRWTRRWLGLAQLRAGRFAEAAASLEATSTPKWSWEEDGFIWPLLAIAHHGLGNLDQARQWLDKTELWLSLRQQAEARGVSAGMGRGLLLPEDYLYACIFYFEAKAVIDGPEAAAEARQRLIESSRRDVLFGRIPRRLH